MATSSIFNAGSATHARLAVLAVALAILPAMSQALPPPAGDQPSSAEAPGASQAWSESQGASAEIANVPWVASGSLLWKSKLEPKPPLKSTPGC